MEGCHGSNVVQKSCGKTIRGSRRGDLVERKESLRKTVEGSITHYREDEVRQNAFLYEDGEANK